MMRHFEPAGPELWHGLTPEVFHCGSTDQVVLGQIFAYLDANKSSSSGSGSPRRKFLHLHAENRETFGAEVVVSRSSSKGSPKNERPGINHYDKTFLTSCSSNGCDCSRLADLSKP